MAADLSPDQKRSAEQRAATYRPSPHSLGGAFGTPRRLLQLWRTYARLDFSFVTRSGGQALTYVVSDAVMSLALIAGMLLLAERFGQIGPWSKTQVIFMLGFATCVGGVLDALFSYNVLYVSRRLGRGQLDHTLLQPQPLGLALLTEGFAPFSGSAGLLPGIALMVWAARRLALPITPGWLVLLTLNLLGAAAVVMAFSWLWGSLAFWAPYAAEEVSSTALRMVTQLKSFPLDGIAVPLAGAMLSILPAGFVAWFPCRALLGIDSRPIGAAITPAAGIAFTVLAMWAFHQGLKHYVRTGSQRYSDFGHRR